MDVLIDGEIVLYGFVGDDFWIDGFTDREVREALAAIGRNEDVTVRINSGGGYTDVGAAIFNALKSHKGKVTVFVEGIAASAASVIAMGGDDIVMMTGSTMMIHDPAGITWGTAADHQKSIEKLDTTAESMADIYAERSGKNDAEARDIMREETWFTAEEAVAEGFADRLDAANGNEPTAFDYRIYQHAPERFIALAKARVAAKGTRSTAALAASTKKESTMPDKPKGADAAQTTAEDLTKATNDASTGERDRIGKILNSDAARGREDQAKYFAFSTDMTPEQAIAALETAPKAEATKPETFADRKEKAADTVDLNTPSDQPQAKTGLTTAVDRIVARMSR